MFRITRNFTFLFTFLASSNAAIAQSFESHSDDEHQKLQAVRDAFVAYRANLDSLVRGDLLMRIDYQKDSGNTEMTFGKSEDRRTYCRLCFDWERGCFAYVACSNSILNTYEDGKISDAQRAEGETALIYKDGKAAFKLLGNPPSERHGSLEPLLKSFAVPAIFNPGINSFGAYVDPTERDDLFNVFQSVIRPSIAKFGDDGLLGMSFRVQLEENKTSLTEFDWDPVNSVPISWNLYHEIKKEERTLKIKCFTEDYEWTKIGDHVLLTQISRQLPNAVSDGKKVYAATSFTDASIHWFTVNKELDQTLFDFEIVRSSRRVRSMIDPVTLKVVEFQQN